MRCCDLYIPETAINIILKPKYIFCEINTSYKTSMRSMTQREPREIFVQNTPYKVQINEGQERACPDVSGVRSVTPGDLDILITILTPAELHHTSL